MRRYALEFYMSIFPGPGITQVKEMSSCLEGTASLTVKENEFCLAGTALSGAPEARRREAWFCGRPWRSSNSGVDLKGPRSPAPHMDIEVLGFIPKHL